MFDRIHIGRQSHKITGEAICALILQKHFTSKNIETLSAYNHNKHL